jgi:hypothetical protein
MRELYIILSVAGWAWCLAVGIFLWVRLRRDGVRRKQTLREKVDGGEEVSA